MTKAMLYRHAAAAALLAGFSLARAADAQTDAPASAPTNTVDEVTVTARHRTESLQDVPESVQAISGRTLEEKNTVTLADITTQTPGLFDQVGNPRNTSIAIRGVGVTSSAGDGLDNLVGVYFDGVYQGRPGLALQDLIDVDAFEVLRGPQGTLFGRNSEVGALNITTNRPSSTRGETFEATFGNYGFDQIKAILTGPITDRITFRTVLFGTYADGWLDDDHARGFAASAAQEGIAAPTATPTQDRINGQERYGARQQFLINATSKLKVRIIGDIEEENDSALAASTEITQIFGAGAYGPNTTAAQQAKVAGALNAFANLRRFGGVQNWTPTVDPNTDIGNSLEQVHTTVGGVSITGDYQLPFATLTSISAWRLWQFRPPQDSDQSPLDIYENEAISRDQQWSQEVRLTSTRKGLFDWQVGAFFFNQHLKDHYIVHQFGADVIPLYDALVNYGALSGRAISTNLSPQFTGAQIIENTHVQDQNQAAYAQVTWHATDRLSLTGGARFTHDRKNGGSPVDLSQLPLAVQGAAVTAGATATLANFGSKRAASGYPISATVENNNVSGSASIAYRLNPRTTLYTTFSNGYQAAALNLNAVVRAAVPAVVRPSTTDNYEAGIKTTLFDRRLSFNADVFYETLFGYQTTYSEVLANGSALRYIANAGNVRSAGVEWDIAAALGHGLRLTLDGSYDDAVFSYAPSVAPPPEVTTATFNATNHDAPDAPKLTLSVTPSYEHDFGADRTLYGYAQYSRSSSYYSATNLSAYSIVPEQFNLNLRVGVRLDGDRYDVSLYANNATNQRNIYQRALLAAPTTSIYFAQYQSLSPPTFYGVTLRAKF